MHRIGAHDNARALIGPESARAGAHCQVRGSARLIAGAMTIEAFLTLYGIGLVAGVAVALIAVAPVLRANLGRRTLPLAEDAAQWANDPEGATEAPVAERKRA
jgi:Flp pilus assembly protein TadB